MEQVQEIVRLLEWAMKLPKELEREYRRLTARIKQEERTPYLASFEREAIRKGLRQGYAEGKQEGYAEGKQEGRQEGLREGLQQGLQQGLRQGLQRGLQQGLLQILEKRFGDVPPDGRQKVGRIQSPEQLLSLYTDALTAATLEDFERVAEQYLNEAAESLSNGSESSPSLTE
ncbi:MAG: hypothetical protein RMK45_03605 [Armatimonadota bacterium]|nr:hypothetical protein [Armatimonadota bacterium]